jgi:hypothetical protein
MPWYANAYLAEEFDSKNMHRGPDGTWAMGVDVSRSLPGLYWKNFFGQPYVEMIGLDRLLAAPTAEVNMLTDGVLLSLGENPDEWGNPQYRAREDATISHLGERFFFSRADPDRKTETIPAIKPEPQGADPSAN